jgi:hypothetical protein
MREGGPSVRAKRGIRPSRAGTSRIMAAEQQHQRPKTWHRNYYHAGELRERGWTEAAIRRFLPEPDRTRINMLYSSAPPVRLWLRERVEAIEATEEYQAWTQHQQRRRELAGARVEARREAERKALEGARERLRGTRDRGILEAIAAAYPELSGECRQRARELGRPVADDR